MTMIEKLLPADAWVGYGDMTYLYTGAHSPTLRASADAMLRAYEEQSRASAGRASLFEIERSTRRSLAALANAHEDEVALVGDASTAWNSVAGGLRFNPGDNVVVNDLEHPSVYRPFLRMRDRGLEVRFARRDEGWLLTAETILASCDKRTRAIAVSSVAFVNGYRHDIGALSRLADERGIPLLVDWSHSLGVAPVDSSLCAIGISASYKWLLGPYGVGIIFWNRERLPDFEPGLVGWRSTDDIFVEDRFERPPLFEDARRFQLGAPAFPSIAALGASVDVLRQLPPGQAQRHAQSLAKLCIETLTEAGLEVITPRDPNRRAGNVAVLQADAEDAAQRLRAHGVNVWGGDGRLRASFHVMNDEADIKALMAALGEIGSCG